MKELELVIRIADTSGIVHGLLDRDIGGRSAGYGSPEVGGLSPPTRSMLLDSVVDVIHDMIRRYVGSFHGRIETRHLRKIAVTLPSITLLSTRLRHACGICRFAFLHIALITSVHCCCEQSCQIN